MMRSPFTACNLNREERPDRCFNLRLNTTLKSALFNQHLALLAFATLDAACGASELHVHSSARRTQAMDNFNWIDEQFETLWDKAELASFCQEKSTECDAQTGQMQ